MASIPLSPGDGTPRGDEAAANALFDRLVSTYYPWVLGFLRGRGFPPEDALDLTQDVFVRALKNIGSLRSEGAARSWILEIATNVWKNELRRRGADMRDRVVISLDSPGGPSETGEAESLQVKDLGAVDPLAELVSADGRATVRAALRELPPQMRRCLMLFTHGGRKYKEIADVMQIKIDTVKSHIHQGRQKLKDRLRSN